MPSVSESAFAGRRGAASIETGEKANNATKVVMIAGNTGLLTMGVVLFDLPHAAECIDVGQLSGWLHNHQRRGPGNSASPVETPQGAPELEGQPWCSIPRVQMAGFRPRVRLRDAKRHSAQARVMDMPMAGTPAVGARSWRLGQRTEFVTPTRRRASAG